MGDQTKPTNNETPTAYVKNNGQLEDPTTKVKMGWGVNETAIQGVDVGQQINNCKK